MLEKPLSEFHRNKNNPDGRTYSCRTCSSHRAATWYAENRERHGHKERAQPISREERLLRDAVRSRIRRKKDKKYSQQQKARTLKWFREHPEFVARRNAQRRVRNNLACPSWADKDALAEVYRRAKELRSATGQRWHVDHVVPLNHKLVCGLHVGANLQIITAGANIEKANKRWPEMPTCS